VYVFLAVTLMVGLWAGRGLKSLEEYAIANRVYGTGVLTLTFLATGIGGSSVIEVAANVFSDGIIATLGAMSPAICMFWMALWVALA
jgi:SSS family solute:Na+ symporter